MGCISSTLMSTSASFQEELNHNIQRSAGSIHNALEKLTISANINNHFPAVSSPNKLESRSCSRKCSKISISMMHILLNNKPSKFKSRAGQGGQDPSTTRVVPLTSRVQTITRSRSCGSFPQSQKLCKDGTEETKDCKAKSFLTVEEYDAMVQQFRRLGEDECSSRDTSSVADYTGKSIDRPETQHKDLKDGLCTTKDSPKQGKSFRRTFIARSLESLEIPHSIEFPIVGPEAYVTPEFGSYSLPKHPTANADVFDPQLVADFEQCMQQLEAETQAILQQISEKLDQNHAKEENPSP